jgi:hypothetical protein
MRRLEIAIPKNAKGFKLIIFSWIVIVCLRKKQDRKKD